MTKRDTRDERVSRFFASAPSLCDDARASYYVVLADAFLLFDFVDADLLEVAFFELLPDDFLVEDLLPVECLPLVRLCLPDPGSARGLAGGTGSFQLNASIWLPT